MSNRLKLINVTPEIARGWLTFNTNNARKLSKSVVDVYASDMAEGRWNECSDIICFSGGNLINGQHRLSAVVQSGVTVPFYVHMDWHGEVFDAHRRRSISALLSIKGIPRAQYVASMLTLWDISKECTVATSTAHVGQSQARLDYLYSQMQEQASFAASLTFPVQPSAFHCAYLKLLMSGCDQESVKAFSHDITIGNGLRGNPARELHRRVTARLSKTETRSRISAIVIQAWNNCAKGVEVTKIFIPESGTLIQKPIVAVYNGIERCEL